MTKRSSVITTKRSSNATSSKPRSVAETSGLSLSGRCSAGTASVASSFVEECRQRPLLAEEVEFLTKLRTDPQTRLCADFPGIERLLEAAIAERKAQDERRIQALVAEYARIMNQRKVVAAAAARSRLTIGMIRADVTQFKRRLVAKAKLPTFNEIRLPHVLRRRLACLSASPVA